MIEEITNIQREKKVHYNVIIIDYDENIADEEDNMYKSGGQIYNKMALFAVVNRTVVFIAAQPRKEYWKMEVIPLEAASESVSVSEPVSSMAAGNFCSDKIFLATSGFALEIEDGHASNNAHIFNISSNNFNSS